MFEESIYASLCDLNISDAERWVETTILIPEEHANIDSNPRIRVVLELVMNALQFCVNNRLSYQSAAILVDAIRAELNFISNSENKSEQESCKQRFLEAVSIYLCVISLILLQILKYNADSSLPVEELKLVTKFYSQQFVKHLETYQYVLLVTWGEDSESRVLEVQTPLCPPLLSTAVV